MQLRFLPTDTCFSCTKPSSPSSSSSPSSGGCIRSCVGHQAPARGRITALTPLRIRPTLSSNVCALGLNLLKTDPSSNSSHGERACRDFGRVLQRAERRGEESKHLPLPCAGEEGSEMKSSSKGPYGRGGEQMSPSTLPCQHGSCNPARAATRQPETPAQKLIPIPKERG